MYVSNTCFLLEVIVAAVLVAPAFAVLSPLGVEFRWWFPPP